MTLERLSRATRVPIEKLRRIEAGVQAMTIDEAEKLAWVFKIDALTFSIEGPIAKIDKSAAHSPELSMEKLFGINGWELVIPTHSVLEMIIRGTLMYLALFVILRFVMRRQAGSIGIADILVIVVIADAAQNGFAREYKSITEGIVLVLTIVFWDFLIDWLGYRYAAIGRLLERRPVPIVQNGKVIRRNMRQEYVTDEELMSFLRKAGVDSVDDVKSAFIEGDGEISVVKKHS